MSEEEKEVMEEVEVEETVEEQTPTEEAVKKLRQERVAVCNKEINTILQKYECSLEASVLLRPGQVIPNIQIVPIELMRRPEPTT